MTERLADVSIDRDGEDLIFRLSPGPRIKAALAWLLHFPAANETAKSIAAQSDGAPAAKAPGVLASKIDGRADRYATPERDARDREIAAYYAAGNSQRDCRKRFGCNQRRVEAALDRTGTAIRSSGRRKGQARPAPVVIDNSDVDRLDQQIRRLYLEQLLSPAQIGDRLDPKLPGWKVEQRLGAMKVPRRSPSEAAKLRWAQRVADGSSQSDQQPKPRPAGQAEPQQTAPAKPHAHQPSQHPTSARADAARNKRNGLTRESEAEIARRYVDELVGVSALAAEFTGGDVAKVRQVLTERGVALRTAAQQKSIGRQEGQARRAAGRAFEPKLPPAPVPADAPRKLVKLAELRQVEEKAKTGSDAVKALRRRAIEADRKRRVAAAGQPLTATVLRDAVQQYFDNGGEIIEVVTEKAPYSGGVPVGLSARANRGLGRRS